MFFKNNNGDTINNSFNFFILDTDTNRSFLNTYDTKKYLDFLRKLFKKLSLKY